MKKTHCDFCFKEIEEEPTIIKDGVEYYFYVGSRQIKDDVEDERPVDICLECIKKLVGEELDKKEQYKKLWKKMEEKDEENNSVDVDPGF